MISDNIALILPILYPSLFEMSKSHWNQQIVQLTQSVLRYLHDVNRTLYDEVAAKHRQNLTQYVQYVTILGGGKISLLCWYSGLPIGHSFFSVSVGETIFREDTNTSCWQRRWNGHIWKKSHNVDLLLSKLTVVYNITHCRSTFLGNS